VSNVEFVSSRNSAAQSENGLAWGRIAIIVLVVIIGIAAYSKHVPQELFNNAKSYFFYRTHYPVTRLLQMQLVLKQQA
jgi:hypothetical protein